ncbi:hypothetical protein UFOVP116_130 [uncultured Caudovirales phage]|uniref:Uncharacterized protein n=1 Tax=uncultured Caudovirales phage TaxID=2100421 RepID=A0A6J5L613_9CAUD|nr:hypothetical protein UFOVP116_130 [uncultured Caudovirales phage]
MRNAKIEQTSLTIFDIDDTLFHTTAKVAVVNGNKVVRKLTNQEFNTYALKAGEAFDFAEFRSASKFYEESTPLVPMMQLAKRSVHRAKQCGKSKVIMVTARANFDNKEKFLDTFRKHEFDIDSVRVERAGNINDIASVAHKKAVIIRNCIRAGQYKKVEFYDDAKGNLDAFLQLQEEFPDVKFDAYLATENGAHLVS